MTRQPTSIDTIPCFECEKGILLNDHMTIQIGEVTVPNVPVHRCDKCDDVVIGHDGNKFIDDHLNKNLNLTSSK